MRLDELFDYDKSIAGEYLRGFERPWEALPGLADYILRLGATLPEEKFFHPAEGVWIARSATVAGSASIGSPCIIDEGAEVRHCAFIRGAAVVGKNAVVGNSTELKNCVLFDRVQVPHFNYVGDSLLGWGAHLGAGAIISNVKSDKSDVTVRLGGASYKTGLRKFGALLGDGAEVGCNSVLCPGAVLGRHCTVYPLSRVRGAVGENTIYKSADNIVEKRR